MLLCELRTSLPSSKRTVKIPTLQKHKTLGAGIQGFAKQAANKPNSVIKVALLSKEDSYEEFINLAMRHQNNPFFPRIYAAKKYRIDTLSPYEHTELLKQAGVHKPPYTPDEEMLDNLNWILIVSMEKLVPIDHPRIVDTMTQVLQQLYGEELIQGLIDEYDYLEPERLLSLRFLLAMMDNKSDLIGRYSKNDKFKQALKLLRPLWNNHMSDIKPDNVMVRLTSTGPQLVLMDPVWTDPKLGKIDKQHMQDFMNNFG